MHGLMSQPAQLSLTSFKLQGPVIVTHLIQILPPHPSTPAITAILSVLGNRELSLNSNLNRPFAFMGSVSPAQVKGEQAHISLSRSLDSLSRLSYVPRRELRLASVLDVGEKTHVLGAVQMGARTRPSQNCKLSSRGCLHVWTAIKARGCHYGLSTYMPQSTSVSSTKYFEQQCLKTQKCLHICLRLFIPQILY